MFARLSVTKNRYVPLSVGAAAVVFGAYMYTNRFAIKNQKSKVLGGCSKWVDIPIAKIEDLSSDTRRFTFKIPEDSVLGLEVASCVLSKCITSKGSKVIRPYTPVSDINEKGTFELVIKHYPDGEMSSHLFSLKPSDTLSFRGPILKWKWVPNSYDSVTLIGGGTGITPLYQLIHHIAQNPNDKTKVNLFYGSKTPSDILLKKELDDLQAKYSDQVKVHYFVDKSDDSFKENTGFITKDFLTANADKPSQKNQVFVCGPPGFMKAYSGEKKSVKKQGELTGILSEIGFTEEQVFKF